MPVELNSPVWNDLQRKEIASRCLTRLAKKFKQERRDAMAFDSHTGIIYRRGSGDGFRRYHQASARGQSPAVDTGNLINSLVDNKLSLLQHEVAVDDSRAAYGKWLNDPAVLDRPTIRLEQAETFLDGPYAQSEIRKATSEMVNGVTGETL